MAVKPPFFSFSTRKVFHSKTLLVLPQTLIVLLIMTNCCTYAQSKRANIWYFGRNAGLDFNSGEPVILDDGEINTNEGCSSIADEEGRLLFYTDGVTVWNRNHEVIQNGEGLLGNATSTQSALIVPQPGSDRFYYVFTVEPQAGSGVVNPPDEPIGFRYNVVDLAANNGMGAVTEKNVFLYAHTTEKLCATQHANGRDYWIATHEWESNRFFVYKLTENGLDPDPVISEIGAIHQFDNSNTNSIGQMKFSPNGSFIGLIIRDFRKIEIFNFNARTGALSNARSISLGFKDAFGSYGIEFSPNSKVLYASELASAAFPDQDIFQFLISEDSIVMKASETVIGTGFRTSSMQLATNGKIYVAQSTSNELLVINEPNSIGVDMRLRNTKIAPREVLFGLPNIASSFLLPDDGVVEFPNVFTPNASDTINAVFEPRIFKRVEFFELKIFNRWGKEVYRTSDVEPVWWNGVGASAGVYYWHLEAEGTNGRPIEQRGVVHLISDEI